MLKSLLIVCVTVTLARAAPQEATTDSAKSDDASLKVIPILEYSEDVGENGMYKFSFKTGDGITREEMGYEKSAGPEGRSAGGDTTEETFHVQQGSWSYVAPNGETVSVKYIADENGFRPEGTHINQAPPSEAAKDNGISSRFANDDSASTVPQPDEPQPTSSAGDKVTTAAKEVTVTAASPDVLVTAEPTTPTTEASPVTTDSSSDKNPTTVS